MKTKLVQLVWRGESSVDPRFSSFMLPWTLADIRNHDNYTRVCIFTIWYFNLIWNVSLMLFSCGVFMCVFLYWNVTKMTLGCSDGIEILERFFWLVKEGWKGKHSQLEMCLCSSMRDNSTNFSYVFLQFSKNYVFFIFFYPF